MAGWLADARTHAHAGRDIMRLASLSDLASNIPRRAYKLYTSFTYSKAILAVVIFHITLALFEPATLTDLQRCVARARRRGGGTGVSASRVRSEGNSAWIAVGEWCCLAIETADLVLAYMVRPPRPPAAAAAALLTARATPQVNVHWRDRRREEELKEMKKANSGAESAATAAAKVEQLSKLVGKSMKVEISQDTILDFVYVGLVLLCWGDFIYKLRACWPRQLRSVLRDGVYPRRRDGLGAVLLPCEYPRQHHAAVERVRLTALRGTDPSALAAAAQSGCARDGQ
jgi:hypothetical protein